MTQKNVVPYNNTKVGNDVRNFCVTYMFKKKVIKYFLSIFFNKLVL